MKNKVLALLKQKALIIDGAMGTQIQNLILDDDVWLDKNGKSQDGCNELLNITSPQIITNIHEDYIKSGADFIKTNSFGAMDWVLDEYDLGDMSYEISYAAAKLVKDLSNKYSTKEKYIFTLGSIGPGTKLPSLLHIDYDTMYSGYRKTAQALKDGGVDVFLIETCQDPLQIKTAINALQDVDKDIPIMVSVTIELTGAMLIGTDVETIVAILEPFDILSLGFNCGTGPKEVVTHIKQLSKLSKIPISVHSNAGLPNNVGGKSVYSMDDISFSQIQKTFMNFDGVSFLGGCCGTTPEHIEILSNSIKGIIPKPPTGSSIPSLASLFQAVSLKQDLAPLLIGERSNATGSKAFKELIKHEKYDDALVIAQDQVKSGAHIIDVSVGFAGRDEAKDMNAIVSLYAKNVAVPLMPDSTQTNCLEVALKLIGGKAIVNSVNLEDGLDKFDEVCQLAKRYGASLVCLVIDENSMAKTKERKLEVATRIYERATQVHGLNASDLVFDMLVFTVGSGDDEYKTAAIETIGAIKEFQIKYPECSTTLGLSNISFGLDKNARKYLNSIFLHHCIEAGLTSAIVNVSHILPLSKINDEQKKICEDLLFNDDSQGNPLFKFIEYFDDVQEVKLEDDGEFYRLSAQEKVEKLLYDGDKQRLIDLSLGLVECNIKAEVIVNEWLIGGMKIIGELFGSGQMQLPFVLQSAETMKATVDVLNPFLEKIDTQVDTTLALGTVKGDVHDVGKNLVDIILSNNGFKVINLGIKVDISTFIEQLETKNISALGFSGLLVKSTNVMKENLEILESNNIKIPILVGGAALTKAFVDDFCRPLYSGDIFYCRDAFDGVIAMQRIEAGGELNTDMPADLIDVIEVAPKKTKIIFDSSIHTPELFDNNNDYDLPFYGAKQLDFDKKIAFDWINHRVLFRQRWGYKRARQDKDKFLKYEKEVVQKLFDKMKNQFLEEKLYSPIAIYGYYYCKSVDTTLNIYDEKCENIIASFVFPRQGVSPHRSICDYFNSDKFDVVGFTFASTGLNITSYEKSLYDDGSFKDYYIAHGLGVELAESTAEILHKQVRIELGVANKEEAVLEDVKLKQYTGCRYSPGYLACPDLAQNKIIYDLLGLEQYGISISQTYQFDPEQSTCAVIVPHSKAKYFNV